MQFLVDDLRAEGRRITGLKLGSRSLRLRADGFDLALTHASGPLPPAALTCVRRSSPDARDTPDLVRARLTRNLRQHSHAMGFIIRQRGALTGEFHALAHDIAQLGRRCLLPVFEAAPPGLLVWQPGGLLFTMSEFLSIEIDELLDVPDPDARTLISASPRRAAVRPVTVVRPIRPATTSRQERAEQQSVGRLFGTPNPARPRVLPRIDSSDDQLTAAFRHQVPAAKAINSTQQPRRLHLVALAALWGILLPQLMSGWLPL